MFPSTNTGAIGHFVWNGVDTASSAYVGAPVPERGRVSDNRAVALAELILLEIVSHVLGILRTALPAAPSVALQQLSAAPCSSSNTGAAAAGSAPICQCHVCSGEAILLPAF